MAMRVLCLFLLFSLECFSLPCDFSLATAQTKKINYSEFEASLTAFRDLSVEELMVFSLRDKKGKAKAQKLQKEELVAYSQVLLEKIDRRESIPTKSFLYKKKADHIVQSLQEVLEKKEFYPEMLAYELAGLISESQYGSLGQRLKSWFRKTTKEKDQIDRNFTVNLWTNSLRDLFTVYGIEEKEWKWYRKIWSYLIRGSLSYTLNQLSYSAAGVFVDGYTYQNLDLKKFYETEDLFSHSLKDLRDIYLIKTLAFERRYSWSPRSLRVERMADTFTKLIHRSALIIVSVMVLNDLLPYELLTKDRQQVEEEIVQIREAREKDEFDQDREGELREELAESNYYSLIKRLRQEERELEQVNKKSIF